MKVDENGNILLSIESIVYQLDDDGKRNLLGYLACDSTIVGWIVDQLADGFFEPNEECPSVYGWSVDSNALEQQRCRLDSKLSEVAKRRISDLQSEVKSAFREGVSRALFAIADEIGITDRPDSSELWSRMCNATSEIERDR